jgi:hypothetical protein
MARSSIILGYWSAVLSLVFTLGYAAGVVLSAVFPIPSIPPHWTSLADFVAQATPVSLVVFTFAQTMAFLAAPAIVALLACLHERAPGDKKVFSRMALCCGIATMVLGCQMYFVHFKSMSLVYGKGTLVGLDPFLEWNWDSPIAASGTLGWTCFSGLAFLFMAPTFSGSRLERALRAAFLVSGACSLFGMVGAVFQSVALTAIYALGFSFGGAVAMILSLVLFKRLRAQAGFVPTG